MKFNGVSQVEHDRLCTQVLYSPWTLERSACDRPAVQHLGFDSRDLRQLRFCAAHWDDFKRALQRDVVMSPDPAWQWVRDHVIASTASRILARVMKDGVAQRKRREAGQQAIAQVIKAGSLAKDIVYFMQSGESGPIKIGTTGNVWSRFSALQVSSPVPLYLRAFQPGDRKVEQQYHETFRDHRLGGEWFEPVPALLATIDAINARAA